MLRLHLSLALPLRSHPPYRHDECSKVQGLLRSFAQEKARRRARRRRWSAVPTTTAAATAVPVVTLTSQPSFADAILPVKYKKRRAAEAGGRGRITTSHYHTFSSLFSPVSLSEQGGKGKVLTPDSLPEKNIFPDSLTETLEAHRDANRARLVRKLPTWADGEKKYNEQQAGQKVDEHRNFGSEADVASKQPCAGAGLENADVEKVPEAEFIKSTGKQNRIGKREDQDGSASNGGPEEEKNEDMRQRRIRRILIEPNGKRQTFKGKWGAQRSSLSDRENRPWLAHLPVTLRLGKSEHHVYDYMTAEILAFERYMALNKAEEAAAQRALEDTRKVIASMKPTLDISVIGSRGNGLAMPWSDIDFNIEVLAKTRPSGREKASASNLKQDAAASFPPWDSTSLKDARMARAVRAETIDLLRTLKSKLKKKGGPKKMFPECFLIEARVPIVSARHNSNLEIQVQSTTSSCASTELVKSYLSEFPTLRPLFLVLKQVLKMRELGEPKRQGIGSYSLLMMIVATLKFSGARFDRRDAARHLLYFFDFYSNIDFRSTGISVDPPELFSRRAATASRTTPKAVKADIRENLAPGSSGIFDDDDDDDDNETAVDVSVGRKHINYISPSHPYLMCLQDPANPYNDLGLQARAIKCIQATFITLHSRTMKAIARFKLDQELSRTSYSILDACLAANYRTFERERRTLGQYGRKHVEVGELAESELEKKE